MKLGLILADQLTFDLASLRSLNPESDWLVMAEVADEASYVLHHKQKIALLFSAMRHFCQQLRQLGWQVHYHSYDPESPHSRLIEVVQSLCFKQDFESLVVTECGEFRLQHAIENDWQQQLSIPIECYEDDRFLCSQHEFRQWAAGRKQLRMEYFYRQMRRKTGLLMDHDNPEGGQWNFDHNNRKRYRGEVALVPRILHQQDAIDHDVIKLVEQHFSHHPGSLEHFNWATTREQAVAELQHFIQHRLTWYGDYQDAMVSGEHTLFHSLVSPYLNCGLLTPLEVCQQVELAYQQQRAPLNAAEGFIRQVIGWREYVRGIYWLLMPQYSQQNQLNNQRDLPGYYWHGQTRMKCMSECFTNTFRNAYAHHIQRLMVTGNFALLAGIIPQQVCDWYLAVYADAYDWVELPNTLGMVMHADAGYLGSKPYAASGNYINKMSDYCSHCPYSVKTAIDSNSCPFNSLYWHFIQRHQSHFSRNPRMTMIYRSWEKMSESKQHAILRRAEYLLDHIEEL